MRRFLNDSTPFVNFCDYLRFQEDLAVCVKNSEFSSPKDDLYQVCLKLASLFWRRFFSQYKYMWIYSFPYHDPSRPPGPWCEQFQIYIISESVHVNMTYFGSVVREKIFKWTHPIFACLWLYPLSRGSGPLFEYLRIPFTQGWFKYVPRLIEIGRLVLEKMIKKYQCIFTLAIISPWFPFIWIIENSYS
jgi:hypothetical protein